MNDTSETRAVRRWCGYFRGWCQAFGPHERIDDRERGLRWLLGEGQVGLILTPAIRRLLYPCLLGRRPAAPPPVCVAEEALLIGAIELRPDPAQRGLLEQARALLRSAGDLHLYQTYHLIYPTGTRILTLTRHAPLPLIYRELTPLQVHFGPPTAPGPRVGDDRPAPSSLRSRTGPC